MSIPFAEGPLIPEAEYCATVSSLREVLERLGEAAVFAAGHGVTVLWVGRVAAREFEEDDFLDDAELRISLRSGVRSGVALLGVTLNTAWHESARLY